MKTVQMKTDHIFRTSNNSATQYKAGQIYERVTEAAADSIVAGGAGRVVSSISQSPRRSSAPGSEQ